MTIHSRTQQDFNTQTITIIKDTIHSSSSKPIHIALSGGTSPISIYQELLKTPIDYSHIHFWWSDERYLPPDDPQNNYFNANTHFLRHLNIPATNIHPYDTLISPEQSAQNYLTQIQNHLSSTISFDLIILGIGADGHTASLFPNTPQGQNQTTQLVIPIFNSPKPPSTRLSFTFPLINRAQNIIVLVKGQEKVDLFNTLQTNSSLNLPFTHIHSTTGNTYWLLSN